MKVAAYCGTRNLYPHMEVAIKSLLCNSDVDKVYILAEDDKLPYKFPKEVEVLNVSDQEYFKPESPNMTSNFSYMALMRAALPLVFPQHDKILSLDVDTIVRRDISDLWEIPLDGYYFASCRETHRSYDDYLYCNHGVVMFNLKALRNSGKADEVIDVLNRCRFRWVDQDVLNYLCQGRIKNLPSEYNVNDWTERPNVVRIMHYAGIKEWYNKPAYLEYKAIPWETILSWRKERYGR